MPKGSLENVPSESMEKWPPAWADYDWAEYDQDDFDLFIRTKCQRPGTA
jgi:hypothetical protein